jgi:hypothetical protein
VRFGNEIDKDGDDKPESTQQGGTTGSQLITPVQRELGAPERDRQRYRTREVDRGVDESQAVPINEARVVPTKKQTFWRQPEKQTHKEPTPTPTRVGALMLRPPQQMLETCEGPWVRAQVAGYRRQPVKRMIPETTGERNKSDADAASMAAGSIARRETNNNRVDNESVGRQQWR